MRDNAIKVLVTGLTVVCCIIEDAHDRCSAIGSSKMQSELGWALIETFGNGMRKTVERYLNNQQWWRVC